MSYHLSRQVHMTFAEAETRLAAELAAEGFGILTEIDVQATLRKKLGVEFTPYKIFGACNPHFAYLALQAEPRIGTMLPCNVIVRMLNDEVLEVSAIDPIASMQAIDNPELTAIAGQIREKLQRVIAKL